ncbi:MAG: hypothetical protein IPI28_11905 [Candidatus Omnitrophica bacterium]|nr:hypothetical protein [Candidatus Omnitrophota bacterium]
MCDKKLLTVNQPVSRSVRIRPVIQMVPKIGWPLPFGVTATAVRAVKLMSLSDKS